MRFMMMVKASPETEANVLPTEAQFAEMGAYNEELIKAGVMRDGMGLQSSQKGARIHIKDGKRWVEDGPFAETKELIAGFWIIEVASKEEAVAWALKVPHPHFDDSSETNIELRQIFEMEDFGESEAIDKMRELQVGSLS